jgi:hypothetical protein
MPFVALLAGFFVYMTSRVPVRLTAFRCLETLGLDAFVAPAFEHASRFFPSLPLWLSGWLVDGLWSYALVGFMVILWREKPHGHGACWVAISLFMGPLWEAGQYVGWIRGTFDWADVAASLVGGAFALLHYKQKGVCRDREESSPQRLVVSRHRFISGACRR